jgi:hypothetical protein
MLSSHLTLHAAAGVVSELLSQLTPKQRKASNMGPGYKAACSSGCRPVLAALLGVAAAQTQQQLPVLLQAAAKAGNLDAWQQLLLQNDSSTSSSQQQTDDDQEEQQHEAESAAAACHHLDWSCLTLQQITTALHMALPKRDEVDHEVGTTQQLQWEAEEEVVRLQMADLLWQVVVVQQGREAALRQFLQSPAPTGFRGTHHPGIAAAAAAEEHLSVQVGTDLNNRLLFCYSTRWFKQLGWWQMTVGRVLWLKQRQLIPQTHQQGTYFAVNLLLERALEAGDFDPALPLSKLVERFTGVDKLRESYTLPRVVKGVIGGHLRRACAAGDAAAVAQLERLVRFAEGVFWDMEVGWMQQGQCSMCAACVC